MKPGITCIWQVSGRHRVSFEDWVRMDLEYIDNWSLWLDLKLVLRTCPAVLGRTGWQGGPAYLRPRVFLAGVYLAVVQYPQGNAFGSLQGNLHRYLE
ncbi:MAG: hypothetical protein D9V47_01400 [Clostridia bacterium]|nr:MAG: hypothetical protein D9V47_01400 [Clostridia bacterium]